MVRVRTMALRAAAAPPAPTAPPAAPASLRRAAAGPQRAAGTATWPGWAERVLGALGLIRSGLAWRARGRRTPA